MGIEDPPGSKEKNILPVTKIAISRQKETIGDVESNGLDRVLFQPCTLGIISGDRRNVMVLSHTFLNPYFSSG